MKKFVGHQLFKLGREIVLHEFPLHPPIDEVVHQLKEFFEAAHGFLKYSEIWPRR